MSRLDYTPHLENIRQLASGIGVCREDIEHMIGGKVNYNLSNLLRKIGKPHGQKPTHKREVVIVDAPRGGYKLTKRTVYRLTTKKAA